MNDGIRAQVSAISVEQTGPPRPGAENGGRPASAPSHEPPSSVLGPLPLDTTGSMAIGQSVASALEALQANKLRAFLTALGIIIGVAAVIVTVGLGEGAQQAVQQRLAGLGTNLLTILPGSGFIGGVKTGNGALPTLTEQDAIAIERQVSGVSAVSPNVDGGVQVVAGSQNWSTRFQGNYPSIFRIQNWQVAEGLPFNQSDENSSALVCDIGQTVATNLFGTADPVGQRILIRNVPFTVKGLLVSKGNTGFRDQDDIILMPYSTAQIRLVHHPFVNDIFIQAASSKDLASIQQQVTSLLTTRHHIQPGKPPDFRVFNNAQVVQTAQQTSDTLTLLLAGVAAVSLIIGGIGIMNIMLVSVTERTREIGIRMAVGAQTSNILSQFLIEAIILGVVGGILGILIGVGGSIALSKLAGWNTVVTFQAIVISFGFAALVGIFFGYYPARKASQLDPIEALRYE